jgi:hypothetical protein
MVPIHQPDYRVNLYPVIKLNNKNPIGKSSPKSWCPFSCALSFVSKTIWLAKKRRYQLPEARFEMSFIRYRLLTYYLGSAS